ncbi:hypothetical protein G3I33_28295, partial [Streptomyces sp. SID9124]|nr:hypothetical protein [Streptomyces sp. SID9124]
RLLSGTGAASVPGAVGWVRADQPAAAARRGGGALSSLQLVSRFRSTASPAAGQLAVYLAAAPLYLPVMQLVQRTMLPQSGPSELAEVLLSGLLKRQEGGTGRGQWYAFEPDVQEALLGPLGRDEALLVLKHCSQYIEQRFGKGGPNFPALAYAQLGDGTTGGATRGTPWPFSGPDGDADAEDADDSEENEGNGGNERRGGPRVPHAFAEVAARVLERFMPVPPRFVTPEPKTTPGSRTGGLAVRRARELVRNFEADKMVQRLIDAVQLLRGAAEHGRDAAEDTELWSEYARCVLRLWEVQGGADLLDEAERAAERAAARPGAVRERAVLAKVLHAAA